MVWILIALVVCALAAWPVWLNSRREPMTLETRMAWAGRWADLPQGFTRYRWLGGARGPVIVAVPGLNTPCEIWDPVAQPLTAIGYRVLVYDLYGRGGSATVGGLQDAAFHVRQLRALLDHLGLTQDLVLMGYSMGGQIAAAFAAEDPHRVQRLVLAAPAGVVTTETRFDRFCRTWPVIGDWTMTVLGGRRMIQVADTMAAEGGAGPDLARLIRRETARRGYLEALLSSRRGLVSRSSEADFRKVARNGIPVLALWGEADSVVPIAAMGQFAQWHRNTRHEMVAGAGHGLLFSHPTIVGEYLRDMLLEAS